MQLPANSNTTIAARTGDVLSEEFPTHNTTDGSTSDPIILSSTNEHEKPSNNKKSTIPSQPVEGLINHPEAIALFLFTSDPKKFEPGILVDFLSAKYCFKQCLLMIF